MTWNLISLIFAFYISKPADSLTEPYPKPGTAAWPLLGSPRRGARADRQASGRAVLTVRSRYCASGKALVAWLAGLALAITLLIGRGLLPAPAPAPRLRRSVAATVAGCRGGTLPDAAGTQQPTHKFLIFFSGHQGSSALADMLGALPEIWIPGFEPLDFPGLSPSQKLAFMQAAFTFPASEAGFAGWRQQLQPAPGMRVDRASIQRFEQLLGKTVAGFKMRPYTLGAPGAGGSGGSTFDGGSRSGGSGGSSSNGNSYEWPRHLLQAGPATGSASNNASEAAAAAAGAAAGANASGSGSASASGSGSRMHTAMSGLNPAVVKALLDRHNVSVVLTLRQNRLKEALSWYKARDLGVRQFNRIKAAKAAAAAAAVGSAATEGEEPTPVGTEPGVAASWGAGGTEGMLRGSMASPEGSLPQAQLAPAPGTAKLHVNVTQVLSWLNYTSAVNDQLRRAAAYFDRPTLPVWYEDFLADPLREAARAAAFLGADGSRLQPSAKFYKAGPDAIQDWVQNYAELCAALEGTPYYEHLDASACPLAAHDGEPAPTSKQVQVTKQQEDMRSRASSGPDRGAVHPSLVTADPNSSGSGQPLPAQQQLLANWCVAKDRDAAGWAGLSDQQCMDQFSARQQAAVAAVRNGTGMLVFKHVHKAGGSTLCKLAQQNMAAESARLPFRADWDTNCAPYEAFLGPHPAVGSGGARPWPGVTALSRKANGTQQQSRQLRAGTQGAAAAGEENFVTEAGSGTALKAEHPSSSARKRDWQRRLQAFWLGGACWLGFLTPPQLRALPHHFRPLTFVASEGPLPDVLPLDAPFAMVTMFRNPLDRVLSSYRWWQFMSTAMPHSPAECHAYSAPANATLEQWLNAYPDNFVTRELVGRDSLYRRQPLTEADLGTAQQRLHYFAAVLLLEQPDSSMRLMQRMFGWRQLGWEQHRAGSQLGSNAMAELPAATLQLLQRRNELDLRLYEYARQLHARQLAAAGIGSSSEPSTQLF